MIRTGGWDLIWQLKALKQAGAIQTRVPVIRKRTPKWADMKKISEIYKERDRLNAIHGENAYQVDHIVPLRGGRVCGLHVHENLRIIPTMMNQAKGNKYEVR